jgi:hypothetical protein
VIVPDLRGHGWSRGLAPPYTAAHLNPLSEFGILHPFDHKQGAFYAADLSQGGMKAVLARIARQLADNWRSGDGAMADRGSQAKNFLPVCYDQLQMKSAAY